MLLSPWHRCKLWEQCLTKLLNNETERAKDPVEPVDLVIHLKAQVAAKLSLFRRRKPYTWNTLATLILASRKTRSPDHKLL